MKNVIDLTDVNEELIIVIKNPFCKGDKTPE